MPNVILTCPICERSLDNAAKLQPNLSGSPEFFVECRFCGQYRVGPIDQNELEHALTDSSIPERKLLRRKAVLAYALQRMDQSSSPPLLDRRLIRLILGEDRLPSLSEQADNVLRWLDSETEPGRYYFVSYDQIGSLIGAESEGAFDLLLGGMITRGLLEGEAGQITMSYNGYERVENLRKASPSGRNAFIAMKFDDAELDDLVENYFKPAVGRTGFALYRLDDRPQAGLIDARLRNEIRQSRFLIVDETHANLGAYWEAGYAEGLEKPVIYTCEKTVFDGASSMQKPHFDTNHHTTVIWERGAFDRAADQLKQIIRFTIPEAKQAD